MKQQIIDLVEKFPKHYSRLIQRDINLKNWVMENCLIESDQWSAKIYSAVMQQTNVCKNGKVRKFDRFSTGFIGCGPASICQCTAEQIGKSVATTKQLYTLDKQSDINSKRQITMLAKYGKAFNSQRDDVKKKLSEPKIPLDIHNKLCDTEWLTNEYVNKQKSLSEIADELGIFYGTVRYYCKLAGIKIRPTSFRSVAEIQISNYVTSLGFTVENSNRSVIAPKELDIYIKEKNFAIEVNGLYWHSFAPLPGAKENRCRHADKTTQANLAGVQLIQITDYEWLNKQSIVKSILRAKLGLNKKVFARKCQIREVPRFEEHQFLDKYHIQGFISSEYAYGLYYDDELVSIMTFAKSRFSKIANYELLRMCSKEDITVVGGVSKLISHAKKVIPEPSIVSYCDLSKGNGVGYLNAGFTVDHISYPGYFWTDGTSVYSRYKCQKKQLAKWLVSFNPALSESENLFNAGYRRYWDCGNLVLTI